MKDFPKHLNSRHDYDFIRDNFPAGQWRPVWLKLLDTRFVWRETGEVPSVSGGVSDQTHQVIETLEPPVGGKPPKLRFVQQERVENRNAKLFQLGFTVAEVESACGKQS